MIFLPSERAVSPVLGGILVFGLAMSLLVLMQVSVVPATNQQVEYEHNVGLQEDFERFQGSSTRVAASGATESVEFDVGVRYPNRLFLVNPAPTVGRMTTEPATVTIENVHANDPETDEYVASLDRTLTYDTRRLVYEPNYRQYASAPRTVYEHGAIYNQFPGDVTLPVTTTSMLTADTLAFVLLDGDVPADGSTPRTLSLHGTSVPGTAVAVTDDGTTPITITLDSLLPQDEWQTYADQTENVTLAGFTDSGDATTPNTVVLTLDPGREYTLSVGRVTVGATAGANAGAYLTSVGTPPASVPANTSTTYSVEVRDAQHNPRTGGSVHATVAGPATFANGVATQTLPVDEDGRASVTVTGIPNQIGTATVTIGRDVDGDGAYTDATDGAHNGVAHDLQFVTTDVTRITYQADVGGAINPNDFNSGSLALQSTSVLGNGDGRLEFEKLGPSSKNVTALRVSFVSIDSQGNSPIDDIEAFDILRVSNAATVYATAHDTTFAVGDHYAPITGGPIVVESGDTLLVDFNFVGTVYGSENTPDTTQTYDLQPGDFFIVSLAFADGTTATYFAGVV